MGFKQKPKARTSRFELRLMPEEAADIEEKAAQAGVSVSEYIRRCALGRRLGDRYDADVILALRDIAINVGLLRNALAENEIVFDADAFTLLGAECVKTIRRMI